MRVWVLTRKELKLRNLRELMRVRKISFKAWLKNVEVDNIVLWDITTKILLNVKYIDERLYNTLKNLPCGSLIEISGYWCGSIFCVENVKVLHKPLREELACIDDLPEDPVEFTRKYYLYVRNPRYARVIKTYSHILELARIILRKHGFIELPTIITGHVSDPGLRGAVKALVQLYGDFFELQSSLIMYKQLYASVFDKIFYIARNVRIEPVENIKTGRHLVEFTQIDIESALGGEEELIRFAETIVYKIISHIISKYNDLIEEDRLRILEEQITKPPYPRLTYEEAVEEVKKMGYSVRFGEELSFEAEKALTEKYNTPIWILHFPTKARGFYYIEDPGKSGFNVDYNLLLPGGYGEVLDGGCREYRYEKLFEKIKWHGENTSKYSWFLEIARAGLIRPTCGWGLGVERLVSYIHGLRHIAFATPHPRLPGLIGP